jgi:hypothetical protein
MKEDFIDEVPLHSLYSLHNTRLSVPCMSVRLCDNEIIQHLMGGTQFLRHLYQHHHHYRCQRSNQQQLLQT